MATWQHLRSSTANKRPTTSLADGRIAINTNTASPGLFFKDSAGTGIVKVGPVHVGTTAPNATPAAGGSSGNYKGEQWLDTSVSPAQMKVWNGSAWVGIVADELPVSKLQDGAARQLLQTDAAGTGVEWTSNVDVPGTLDVTSTATFDSIARHPLGSAAAPTLTFTGDTNTGIYSPGADQVAVATNGEGRLFVDASGSVGIGAPSSINGLELSRNIQIKYAGVNVDPDGSRYLIFNNTDDTLVNNQPLGGISWVSNDASATAGEVAFVKAYAASNTGSAYLTLGTGSQNAATERLRITSGGFVGIGTTSPGRTLSVNGVAGFGNGTIETIISFSDRGIFGTASNHDLELRTNNTERARITSSGQLLVGTSTSPSAGALTQYANFVARGNTGGPGFAGVITVGRGEAATSITSGEEIGYLTFSDLTGNEFATIHCAADANAGAGDYPGRLVFSTTADGASSPTERMRIGNAGNTNTFASAGNSGFASRLGEGAGTVYTGLRVLHSATSTTNGTESFKVFSNGNVENTNNSYGAISDIKLKENIVDANSQWDDIKALQVRNYNFKEGQTHTQIGLVAQEVELVSPGLVSESPDRDSEGNDLGTVTKSVNYSVLYMKAVKALQEAMERIETLEAKVAGLESA